MKKKILIVGAGITANEICKRLKKKYHISTCGINKFDKAVGNSDKHYFFNYKNHNKLLKFCKKGKFDFIIPDGNDISYLSSSYVAEKLDYDGFENYKFSKNILNKISFNTICKKNNISVPKFSLKKNFYSDKIKMPVIFRPNFTYSGKNVFKIENKKDLLKLKKNKTKKFIVSQFINGTLHSCSMIINQKGNRFFFVDEFCNENPFRVDFSSCPSIIQKKTRRIVIKNLLKLTKIFRLTSGILHIQFIKKNNKIFIIEATRRCPGDFYGILIQKSYNFDYYSNYSLNFTSPQSKLNYIEKRNLFFRKTLKNIEEYNSFGPTKEKKLFLSYNKTQKNKYGVIIFKK